MKTYTTEQLAEILRLHRLCILGDATGVRANLSGSNLSGSNLRYSDLSGSNLSGSNLRYSDLSGIKSVAWQSHALLSEILWRAAKTESQQMLAAFVGRQVEWCWDDWSEWDHPLLPWAIGELAKYVVAGDKTVPAELLKAIDHAKCSSPAEVPA